MADFNRRKFLLGSVVGAGSLSALWLALRASAPAKIVESLITPDHHVDNAKPVPPFQAPSFAQEKCIRFFVIGDWGTGNNFQRRVAASMSNIAQKEKPQFIVSTGDNFYPDGVQSINDPQFKSKWLDIYNSAELQVPWYVTLGNHDYHAKKSAEIEYSKVNARWIMPAAYFSFKQQQEDISAEFFVLDTEMLMHGTSDDINTQIAWLESSLKKSTAMWRVAVGHHMIRSHGAYGDQKFMLSKVKPLLDKYGVQMYLNGHDHDIQYLKAAEDSFICVISGAGGGARNSAYGQNTRFAATNGGFVYITLTQKTLHLQFIDAAAHIMYAEDAVRLP